MMSSGSNSSQRLRNKVFSPVRLPWPFPRPASNTAPVPKQNTTTIRAIGKPRRGFWDPSWGYACWLAGVSGMITVLPSTTLTRRPHEDPPDQPEHGRLRQPRAGLEIRSGIVGVECLTASSLPGGDPLQGGAAGVIG